MSDMNWGVLAFSRAFTFALTIPDISLADVVVFVVFLFRPELVRVLSLPRKRDRAID
jgi:hypothetical protein